MASSRGFFAVLFFVVPCILASDVVVLTDGNFEHLTQASTGATTGDWLIEFYAPWCGHCQHLAPVYEEVATELKGTINVAKVDATENMDVASRFGIEGFPTLMFLRQGKIYHYNGPRDAESLVTFCESDYALDGVEVEAVPPPLSTVDKIVKEALHIYHSLAWLVEEQTGPSILLVSIGFLLGCVFCSIIFSMGGPPPPKSKTN